MAKGKQAAAAANRRLNSELEAELRSVKDAHATTQTMLDLAEERHARAIRDLQAYYEPLRQEAQSANTAITAETSRLRQSLGDRDRALQKITHQYARHMEMHHGVSYADGMVEAIKQGDPEAGVNSAVLEKAAELRRAGMR